jgi:hypothetical protein
MTVRREVFWLRILIGNGLTIALYVFAAADLFFLLEPHLKSWNQVKFCIIVQVDCIQNHACFALVLNIEVIRCLSSFVIVFATANLLRVAIVWTDAPIVLRYTLVSPNLKWWLVMNINNLNYSCLFAVRIGCLVCWENILSWNCFLTKGFWNLRNIWIVSVLALLFRP